MVTSPSQPQLSEEIDEEHLASSQSTEQLVLSRLDVEVLIDLSPGIEVSAGATVSALLVYGSPISVMAWDYSHSSFDLNFV